MQWDHWNSPGGSQLGEYWRTLDYYQLLEVDRDAHLRQMKQQRDLLIYIWHPDRAPQSYQRQATERTAEINRAWDTLSDPQRRRQYNLVFPPKSEDVDPSGQAEDLDHSPAPEESAAPEGPGAFPRANAERLIGLESHGGMDEGQQRRR